MMKFKKKKKKRIAREFHKLNNQINMIEGEKLERL